MIAAEEAAPRRTPTRRPHRPDAPYLVPSIAAGHRDPVVRELCDLVTQLYFRRGALGNPLLNRLGDILFPAFGELLRKPQEHSPECPKRQPGGKKPQHCDCPRPPDHARRRSDFMEAVVRSILALASCCNWITMEILDPSGGYLSVARLAELADLPHHMVAPGEDDDPRRRRYRMDTAERALRLLRDAHILPFTKQHREELEDGRHTSTAPALRKLSVHFFLKWGGRLAEVFKSRRRALKKAAERLEGQASRAGVGVDLGVREELGQLRKKVSPPPAPGRAPADESQRGRGTLSRVPIEMADAIHEEHPDWDLGQVMTEARQRMRERQPPTGGSSEPSSSK
jgi:hypothetical protein